MHELLLLVWQLQCCWTDLLWFSFLAFHRKQFVTAFSNGGGYSCRRKALWGFVSSHSIVVDGGRAFIGGQVIVRATRSFVSACVQPVKDRLTAKVYEYKRKVKSGCLPPIEFYGAIGSLCCLEGTVKAYVTRLRERHAQQNAPKPRLVRAKQTMTPIFDEELGYYVLFDHPQSIGERVQVTNVVCGPEGNTIHWEVVRYHPAQRQLLRPVGTKARASDETTSLDAPRGELVSRTPASSSSSGNEKRVKPLVMEPGWDLTKMTQHFSWVVILILDNRPFGIGFRNSELDFQTPYHMGPVGDRKLEIMSVAEYEENGEDGERVAVNTQKAKITTLDYSSIRSKTGFDQMLVELDLTSYARAGISVYKQGYDKSIQGDVFALGFDMTCRDTWKPLCVHKGSMRSTPAFTASWILRGL